MELKDAIRTIPDFPKPGIMFRDVTTLMGNPRAFRQAVDELVQPYAGQKIDKVAGIEARGFILGGDDFGGRQHRGVRLGPLYILAPQLAVEADRCIYLLHNGRRAGGESAAPQAIGLAIGCAGRARF